MRCPLVRRSRDTLPTWRMPSTTVEGIPLNEPSPLPYSPGVAHPTLQALSYTSNLTTTVKYYAFNTENTRQRWGTTN